MKMTILQVAYSVATVTEDTAGGAEQVLLQLDRALVQRGHRSLVIACEGSRVAGTLLPTVSVMGTLDPAEFGGVHRRVRRAIESAIESFSVDLIHMHGIDFYQCLPRTMRAPILATLHLPLGWYATESLRDSRPNLYRHCVSVSQHEACLERIQLGPEIQNGVDVEAFSLVKEKGRFALSLGRVCPEKGFHLALEAAKRAGVPMLLAGKVFPYLTHVDYFEREIRPRLDERRRFMGPVGFAKKRRLLGRARCLLVPSLVPETSSLVAMEALACGTPVIAFPAGALPEIVEHGRTGFLVHDEQEMAEAIHAVENLNPEECRRVAVERFSLAKTVERYLELYGYLIAASHRKSAVAGAEVEYVG